MNDVAHRLAALEQLVAEFSIRVKCLEAPQDWRSTLGMFSGDQVMKQIDEETRKIREADRAKARKAQRRRTQGC